MIKRTIILTTAAVCLAASLMLIVTFSMRRAAEPAFIGEKFTYTAQIKEPGYEHMRERMKEFEKYIKRIKGKDGECARNPKRPEKMLRSDRAAA